MLFIKKEWRNWIVQIKTVYGMLLTNVATKVKKVLKVQPQIDWIARHH
jgi:hypothetical protein